MTGLQNAIGKTARELVPDLEAPWFEIYGRVVRTGEPVRFENQSVAMNRWFDVNAFRVSEMKNNQFALLFTDVTDRKQVEQALRDSENRFRMAIESAQLGTWDWNLITNQLIWDEGCKAMFGLPPEALCSIEVFFAGLHPDDRERLEQLVQWTLNPKSNGKYDAEYRTIGIH